jgi:hypothetical protein
MTESPNASSTGSEVIVVEDPDGALVVGDGTALEAFIAEWESRGAEFDTAAELTGGARTRALSMAANVASIGAAPVRYLQARKMTFPSAHMQSAAVYAQYGQIRRHGLRKARRATGRWPPGRELAAHRRTPEPAARGPSLSHANGLNLT